MNWVKSFWKRLRKASADQREISVESNLNVTPRAQQILVLARKEADRLKRHSIGIEHLLLGLIKFGRGVAANVLKNSGLNLENVREEIEKQIGSGPDDGAQGFIGYTPQLKKALILAQKEARALNHTYVGTEHLLLGLMREGEGVAARVLKSFSVDIEQTRKEILKELDPNIVWGDNGPKEQS